MLRKIITKRGTLEILIPLCCTTDPIRYLEFKQTLKGISSKTLAARLKDLQKSGILEREAYKSRISIDQEGTGYTPVSIKDLKPLEKR
jgi:DNA-binding HxlR family transcriptional regulator